MSHNLPIGTVVYAPSLPFVEGIPAGISEPATPSRERLIRGHQRKRAAKKANAEVMERYERFLVAVAPPTFVACEITALYEKRYEKLSQTDAKGLGWLFGDMQMRGVIEKTGTSRTRKNGCPAAEYRLRK